MGLADTSAARPGNGYRSATHPADPQPLPHNESAAHKPSQHPHSCRKTRKYEERIGLLRGWCRAGLIRGFAVEDFEVLAKLGEVRIIRLIQPMCEARAVPKIILGQRTNSEGLHEEIAVLKRHRVQCISDTHNEVYALALVHISDPACPRTTRLWR